MKLNKFGKSILVGLIFLLASHHTFSQTNKSAQESYKKRVVNSRYDYATTYDNGYVTLRDGTTLYGQISLGGKSFENIYVVKIRTNAGKRYVLTPRSLKEFGLINSLINDTPDLFKWEQLNEKSAITGFQDLRTGFASFGYVKTKAGKTLEGELTLKESNGRIRNITVKKGDNKTKLDAEEISNFGVKQYVDEKFEGVWSVIQWKKNLATGMLVNKKSIPAQGVVILTDGSTEVGYITIIKKNEITTQLQVRLSLDAKKGEKIKYNAIESYKIEQRISDYDAMLKTLDTPYEALHPSRKFHSGTIELLDGTIIKGQIAKASNSDYTDVFFAEDINSIIKGFPAAEIENTTQSISDENMAAYNIAYYDYTHAQDYLIQKPAQWKIQSKDEFGYVTEFQPGYLILTTGEEKVGALSVTESSGAFRYILEENGKKVRYSNKEVVEHGLIVNEASTQFREQLFFGVFVNKRPGFVRLTGSDDLIKGDLKLKRSDNGPITDVVIDGNKHKIESVDIFGLTDVPMEYMTSKGRHAFGDEKRNFHPGSFTLNGENKEGFIAWGKPNGAGEYKAFFYADKMDGVANVYYLKDGASNVKQSIQTRPEEPEAPNFEAASDTTTIAKTKGYVITPGGEKIEGIIQLTIQPKKWYPTDITLTHADGTVKQYNADNPVSRVVLFTDGSETEYLNYKDAYVEVLHRDSSLVHFRNPFPTTNSIAADFLNYGIQREEDAVNAQFARNAEYNKTSNSRIGRAEGNMTISDITIYAVEFLLYDETTERTTMYVPNQLYYFNVKAELQGCIEYLTLDITERIALKNMQNPLATLEFLNVNMNN